MQDVKTHKKEGERSEENEEVRCAGGETIEGCRGRDEVQQKKVKQSTVTHRTGRFFAPLGQKEGAWDPRSLLEGTARPHSRETARMNHLL